MKPQPLRYNTVIEQEKNYGEWAMKEDIESAVAWLKREVNDMKLKNFLGKCDVMEKIDEAFGQEQSKEGKG